MVDSRLHKYLITSYKSPVDYDTSTRVIDINKQKIIISTEQVYRKHLWNLFYVKRTSLN